MTSALLIAGAAGLVGFVVVFMVDGATREGYRPVYHPVSALALGRRGWLQMVNFVVCGSLVVGGAVGLYLADVNLLLAVIVGIFGLSLVASGVFPMDPMRSYPPGTPPGDPGTFSTAHVRHDNAGAGVFTSLPVAALVATFAMDPWGWKIYSLLTAVGFFAIFMWFVREWEHDGPHSGLAQRLSIVSGWIWLAGLFAYSAG